MSDEKVLLGHGSGGSMMKRLIDEVFFTHYGDEILHRGDDAGVAPLPHPYTGKLAMSTDGYVVTPHFFPGGDIGRVAVCGTVNDVATSGAEVLYLSCAFILEEGFPTEHLTRIVTSMAQAADEAGVNIITGDTKVVDKGHGDGIFITTSGVGIVPEGIELSGANCKPGDKILISGTIGDHGICIMSQRENLSFYADIPTDAAPLNHMMREALKAAPHIRCMRDPTRGGVASTLNEFAQMSACDIEIEEMAVPLRDDVRGACEMLGYDPFQVANEGKIVVVVPAEEADAALAALQASPYGKNAALIGQVVEQSGDKGRVWLRTPLGATRVLDMLIGEQLPRIC